MPHDFEELRRSLVDFGATKVAHLDGDLLSHMTNVYHSLERMKRPEHVMLAGLFHGVYGTHGLRGTEVFTLTDEQRDHVRGLVGEDAERVVYRFCVMSYESLGKSVRSLMRPGGTPQLWNRSTNAPLEVTREEFLDVLWVKFADLLAHLPQLSPETRRTVTADYGPFWQLVAEYLGPMAIEEWNREFGDTLMIRPSHV